MKRTIQILIVATTLFSGALVMFAQDPVPQQFGPGREGGGRFGQTARSGQCGLISALPYEEPSEAEVDALILMREEEKLARDVYLALYEVWDVPIFWNIAESEQRHFDAVGILLEKYKSEDPAYGEAGEFRSGSEMGILYGSLVSEGMVSLQDAFHVGATIEDLDIHDLRQALADQDVDNRDITIVFQNLLNGSINHLHAFTRLLSSEYEAQHLTQPELDEILNTERFGGRFGGGRGNCRRDGSGPGAGGGNCYRQGGPGN